MLVSCPRWVTSVVLCNRRLPVNFRYASLATEIARRCDMSHGPEADVTVCSLRPRPASVSDSGRSGRGGGIGRSSLLGNSCRTTRRDSSKRRHHAVADVASCGGVRMRGLRRERRTHLNGSDCALTLFTRKVGVQPRRRTAPADRCL
jgi:hypothetical protein